MKALTITQTIPVAGEYDVVVCGGGSAGWIAAVTAARLGCRTALIERYGFLGGTATAGLVSPISGFYLNGRQVVGGIPYEFVRRLEAEGGAVFEMPRGHITYDPERYKLIAQRMVCEAGVDLYMNASLFACTGGAGKTLQAAVFAEKSGLSALSAACFIDATGDADLARLAGVRFLPDAEDGLQPLSLCFMLGGVDTSTPLLRDCIHHNGLHGSSCNAAIHDCLAEACSAGELSRFGGPWFNAMVQGDALIVNATRLGADARDARALRDAEFTLREDMFAIVEKLRRTYPEFARCTILTSGVQAGVRETRRIAGLYTLTGAELLGGASFPDSVALSAHPVDIHLAGSGNQQLHRLDRSAGIPLRTMLTPDCPNLLCAGRCISADRMAYASIRVQGTAMALGQAAAVAAALANRNACTPAELNATEVRRELHALGGITE